MKPSPKEEKAPRYRFAVIVWLAIYPAVTLAQWLLGPVMEGWPVPLKTLVISVIEIPYAVFFAIPLLQTGSAAGSNTAVGRTAAIESAMHRQREVRWVVFLLVLLVAVVGLMTRFHFGQTTDIQVHDTYFVVANVHLLVVVGLVLIVAYGLTLGLEKLATFHNKLKILSALITGTIALGFSLLGTLMTIIVLEYPTETWHALYYGIMLLWIGLVVLFTLRTIEIVKKVT